MRKIKLSLFLVFLCFFLVDAGYCNEGFNIVLDTKDSSGLKMSFVLQDYAVKTLKAGNQTFSEVNIKGGVKTSEKGFAELPFMHASVSLPATGGIEVEVISTDYQDIELEHPILPSKGTIYRNQNPDDIAYEIARNSIVDQWYPKNLVTFTEPYIFRNIRGSNIYIYPFRYNAVTKTLRIYSKVQVQVKFTSKTGKTNTLRPARQKILPVMNNIYQSMFINYQTSKSRFDNEVGESGDILVICTSRDTDAIQPYIEWKREKGFNVEEEVVETGTNVEDLIASNYAANNNLLYVQLVGDWNDIKSNTMEGGAPMDPMLGCVAGNDSYPELAIGRFSAESSDQVTVQVNKVLAYEQDAGSTGSWYDNALGIGSGLGSGQGDDGEPDYEHIDIIKNEKLLTATHTVVEEVYKTGSASTVGGYVDSGLSLINYCGHGSSNSWGTSGFSSSDVNDLRNGDMLPVIISVACVNGAFHKGTCFAEAWLRKQDGGAVAALMSTINQPWTPPMRGQDYMNDLLIGGYDYQANPGNGTSTTSGRNIFGSIVLNGLVLMYAESSGSQDLETISTWTTFGDASLQVRTQAQIQIDISNIVVRSGDSFSTQISDGVEAVSGAMVVLKQNDLIFKGITDDSGHVTIEHELEAGTATLVVSGSNLETIYQEIQVEN